MTLCDGMDYGYRILAQPNPTHIVLLLSLKNTYIMTCYLTDLVNPFQKDKSMDVKDPRIAQPNNTIKSCYY
ncbi:hypothetical protein Hanom_Chr07g00610861 [Helianthus anomalus]